MHCYETKCGGLVTLRKLHHSERRSAYHTADSVACQATKRDMLNRAYPFVNALICLRNDGVGVHSGEAQAKDLLLHRPDLNSSYLKLFASGWR